MCARDFSGIRLLLGLKQRAIAGAAILWLGAADTMLAGGLVTNCTETALRAALAGGGNVTFACDGTISLSNTLSISADTVLDGGGHQVTLSGGGLVQVLSLASGQNLVLLSLAVADGSGPGGGIYVGGQLNATNCSFHDNTASPYGGAIYNDGTLNASQCTFWRNRTVGSTGIHGQDGAIFARASPGGLGSLGCGGAIYNARSAVFEACLFAANVAVGGSGGAGGNGTIVIGTYSDQTGGSGGDGGNGQGGAIFNVGTAIVINCTFTSNSVSGGSVEPGASGAVTPGTLMDNLSGLRMAFPADLAELMAPLINPPAHSHCATALLPSTPSGPRARLWGPPGSADASA